jgi:hypothetical protein
MKQINLSILIGFLFSALMAAGCGSGDPADSASAAPTKNQFIKQADSICEQAEVELFHQVVVYKKQNPTAGEGELVEAVGLPPLEKEIRSLKKLAAPEGDEAQVQAWIEAFEGALQQVKKNPQLLLNLRNNPFGNANKRASDYGTQNCKSTP